MVHHPALHVREDDHTVIRAAGALKDGVETGAGGLSYKVVFWIGRSGWIRTSIFRVMSPTL